MRYKQLIIKADNTSKNYEVIGNALTNEKFHSFLEPHGSQGAYQTRQVTNQGKIFNY